MLRFLTHKLRSQSLNEVQPFQAKDDEDRDSGTESDEENAELEELEKNTQNGTHYSNYSGTMKAPNNVDILKNQTFLNQDRGEHQCQTPQDLQPTVLKELTNSDQNSEHPSSEEELERINGHPEKRKWSQANRFSFGESSGSSDEEVKDFMCSPAPLQFSSSPPFCAQRLNSNRSPPPKLFLANIAPVEVCRISPRKRHRQTDSEVALIERPCLDFEKMQQRISSCKCWGKSGLVGLNRKREKLVRKHSMHSLNRARLVKIKAINNGRHQSSRFLYDPSVFSFRSISTINPLPPVEEPSCAY